MIGGYLPEANSAPAADGGIPWGRIPREADGQGALAHTGDSAATADRINDLSGRFGRETIDLSLVDAVSGGNVGLSSDVFVL